MLSKINKVNRNQKVINKCLWIYKEWRCKNSLATIIPTLIKPQIWEVTFPMPTLSMFENDFDKNI